VRLTLLCPYHLKDGEKVPDGFDEAYYPFNSKVPYRIAIVKANEKAVDICDYFIMYVKHPGKSRDILHMVQKKAQRGFAYVENIADNANTL